MSIQDSLENKVNQLLIDFNFNKPNTILDAYIKDMP